MSRRVLVFAEPEGVGVTKATHELIEAAFRLGGDAGTVAAVLPTPDAAASEAAAAALADAEVLLVEGPAHAGRTAEESAAAVLLGVETSDAELVLLPHSPTGWDAAPLVAAQLGTAALTGVSRLRWGDDGLIAERQAFQGKFVHEIGTSRLPAVATVERGSFPARAAGPAAGVRTLASPLTTDAQRSRLLEVREAASEGVDLTASDVVVSAGRGMGGPEHLHLVEELAEALGGAVGASRAVTDAGWLPHDRQIGSSGVTVSPKLYVACGISGAIQHLVGMRGSRFVVAVNKDPDAPIFGAADVGVVADVKDILPALKQALTSGNG